jgi:hypothetical protein
MGLAIFVSVIAYGSLGESLLSIFLPDEDVNALNNFGALYSATQTVLNSKVDYQSIRTPFQLTKNYCVVAFDTGFVNGQITDRKENAYKPDRCHQQACMCVYKKPYDWGTLSDMEGGLIKCYTFDYQKIIFYSEDVKGNGEEKVVPRIDGTAKIIGGTTKNFKIAGKNEYKNFVIFGDGNKDIQPFGTHDLWIEKRVIDKENYIYISIWNAENIEKRRA